MSKKCAVLSSTGASVVSTVYQNSDRSDFDLELVITDRECGATSFARKNRIHLEKLPIKDPNDFSVALRRVLDEHEIDYVYLFFTRLLKLSVLQKYKGRIINFHPSLLPACPGLHGFEDTIKSGAIIAGSTVHFVDEGMDTGKQIMQTFVPTIGIDTSKLRHIIFSQQCAALFYIHRKIQEGADLKNLPITQASLNQGFFPNIDCQSFSLYQKLLALR